MSLGVEVSTDLSIVVQVLTGIVSFNGIFLQLPETHAVLIDILEMETIVQVVELTFYVVALRSLAAKTNGMAAMRYFDWFITTPTMLLTTAVYFKYEETHSKGGEPLRFREFVKTNRTSLMYIAVCNFFMLLFGYFGETGKVSKSVSVTVGSVFFVIAFHTLYTEFAIGSATAKKLFFVMCLVWSLYGLAFTLPDTQKNNMFNILDIFAKNFFGLYLFYKARRLQQQYQTGNNLNDVGAMPKENEYKPHKVM